MEKVCSTLKALERRIGLRRDATRAPIQGPEWQGAASPPPQTQTQTPPDLSLLTAKIGLDNGVHCKGMPFSIRRKWTATRRKWNRTCPCLIASNVPKVSFRLSAQLYG